MKKVIDKIEEGWAGKPMGIFHECWLLGLIDPNQPQSRYTKMDRKEDKDADGNLTDEGKKYCLSYLRSQCSNFQNEKSAIECILYELSQEDGRRSWYTCDFTPKYHCELAGEGKLLCLFLLLLCN